MFLQLIFLATITISVINCEKKGCTEEEYKRTRGACNNETWLETRKKCYQLRNLLAKDLNSDEQYNEDNAAQDDEESAPRACFADLMLTPSQLDAMLSHNNRRKRSASSSSIVINIKKWSLPIRYKIDPKFSESQDNMIQASLDLWLSGTCMRFERIRYDEDLHGDNHLLFSRTLSFGCGSYVGDADLSPQPIFLSATCFTPAVIAHEIGHALGRVHEHQRLDRNNYVYVNARNIASYAMSNFDRIKSHYTNGYQPKTTNYDYGSAMHYAGMAFTRFHDGKTLRVRDERFQRTLGQRVELSFLDTQTINNLYCEKTCRKSELRSECRNSGYQDPSDCSRCICPSGWEGSYCDWAQRSKGSNCGGTFHADNDNRYVNSPGYYGKGYQVGDECTWLIKAPQGYRVKLTFVSKFGIYCSQERCIHWLEIRTKDLGKSGPRYCCKDRPRQEFISDSNEILLNFKAKSFTFSNNRVGFQFSYTIVRDENDRTKKKKVPTATLR